MKLTREGWTVDRIAQHVGLTTRMVQRVRARAGVAQKPRRLTAEQLARAETLLTDGASYRDVARTVGCHPTTLQARFPGMGWPPGEVAELRAAMARLEAL